MVKISVRVCLLLKGVSSVRAIYQSVVIIQLFTIFRTKEFLAYKIWFPEHSGKVIFGLQDGLTGMFLILYQCNLSLRSMSSFMESFPKVIYNII